MKTEPDHQHPIDQILEDETMESRSVSFQRTMRAARSRSRSRQAMTWGAPLFLALGVLLFQGRDGLGKKSTTNLVMHSQSKIPIMGKTSQNDSNQEPSYKIPRLTDSEFENIMKGQPMAIIRQGGETLYVPLNLE